jgi:two-component system chemotaxis response regulator CheB
MDEHHDIMVIGASLGGVQAISELIAQLPANLPAAIFVVQHVAPHWPDLLAGLLRRSGNLTAEMAMDGAPIKRGRIYVARPNYHLLLEAGRMRVVYGPRENHWRPAIDPLFRSAAVAYGPRVAAVILTGLLHDGAAGLDAVKKCGGVAIIQDPADALHREMPEAALARVEADFCVPLAQMGKILTNIIMTPPGPAVPVPDDILLESRVMESVMHESAIGDFAGSPTALTCPECGGTLKQIGDQPLRFRCHTGHALCEGALLESQNEGVEYSLWAAVRAMKERCELLSRMAASARERGYANSSEDYEQKAAESMAHAEQLRRLLARMERVSPPETNGGREWKGEAGGAEG